MAGFYARCARLTPIRSIGVQLDRHGFGEPDLISRFGSHSADVGGVPPGDVIEFMSRATSEGQQTGDRHPIQAEE